MNMCQHRTLVKLITLHDLKPADLSRFHSVRDDNCLNGIQFYFRKELVTVQRRQASIRQTLYEAEPVAVVSC